MTERWIEDTADPHGRVALLANEVLHEAESGGHQVAIFRNATWGTVLSLDGACRHTTADGFIQHEMLAHVPLMSHDKPRRVLIVGGGDGGVLRECLKHPSVTKAVVVESDRAVIDAAQKYFPETPGGAFDDVRTEVVLADSLNYLSGVQEPFDVIIVECSWHPESLAAPYTREFLAACRGALDRDGVLAVWSGLPFLVPDHLKSATALLAPLFKRVTPYFSASPSAFGGPLALSLATDTKGPLKLHARDLAKRQDKREIADLKYWTPHVHVAAFALPACAMKIVEDGIAEARAREIAEKEEAKAAAEAAKIEAKERAVQEKAAAKAAKKEAKEHEEQQRAAAKAAKKAEKDQAQQEKAAAKAAKKETKLLEEQAKAAAKAEKKKEKAEKSGKEPNVPVA